jgi:hypothetical protein
VVIIRLAVVTARLAVVTAAISPAVAFSINCLIWTQPNSSLPFFPAHGQEPSAYVPRPLLCHIF